MIFLTRSMRAHVTVCCLVCSLASPPVDAADVDFTSSNLPIVLIDTRGRAIPDEPKVEAWMGIIDNGVGKRNDIDDDLNGYDGAIGIELRGSSSQGFAKRSYSVETRDADGENLNLPLLGMPEENDWILHGPYSDKSLMRNVIAYWIKSLMGRYASRTRFCEVVLNGDYIGVYVMVEKIKRDVNRVDIAKMEATDSAGDAVTGGYILRIDRFVQGVDGGWYSRFGLEEQLPYYRYEYPKDDRITPAQELYIQGYINILRRP